MPPLAAIERFFERLFERPSARLFRARLQPIQLQRRIERAMEAERLATADRTLVPEPLRRPPAPGRPGGFGDMTTSLASELADGALVFARAHHYTLVDRPRVDLVSDPAVERTDIRVVARFADPIGGRPPRPGDGRDRSRPCRCRGGLWRRLGRARPTRWSSPSRGRAPRRRAFAIDRAATVPSGRPTSTVRACDRPGQRQRPGARRQPRLAPPRPAHRPSRHARLQRPRQHQWLTRERRGASPSSSSVPATGSSWATP